MPKPYKAIKPMFHKHKWRIFPGDLVRVNGGKDRNNTGRVLAVIRDPRIPEVIVEGVNMRKKKIPEGTRENVNDFFVVTMEAPIHYSRVNLINAEGRAVRTGFRYTEKGELVRVAKGSGPKGGIFPIPEQKDGSKTSLGGPSDTAPEVAREQTYTAADNFPVGLLSPSAGYHTSTGHKGQQCLAARWGFAASGLLLGSRGSMPMARKLHTLGL